MRIDFENRSWNLAKLISVNKTRGEPNSTAKESKGDAVGCVNSQISSTSVQSCDLPHRFAMKPPDEDIGMGGGNYLEGISVNDA